MLNNSEPLIVMVQRLDGWTRYPRLQLNYAPYFAYSGFEKLKPEDEIELWSAGDPPHDLPAIGEQIELWRADEVIFHGQVTEHHLGLSLLGTGGQAPEAVPLGHFLVAKRCRPGA